MPERLENPWTQLSHEPPYILDSDVFYINEFNGRVGAKHQIHTEILPEPYLGNPMAPVVLLNLNPGWSSKDPAHHGRADFVAKSRANLLHGREEFPFYLLDPELVPHRTMWWEKRLGPLIKICGQKRVAQRLFCAEYFPYHSSRFRKCSAVSQRYTFQLVRSAVLRGAVILIMRSGRRWLKAVPELERCSSVYTGANVQMPFVSPGNFNVHGRFGFDAAVEAICKPI